MADPADRESVTRDVPPLSMRGAFAPESVSDEKRTVDLVWTTGARVKRGGFWTDPYWEELAVDPKCVRMGRLNNGAPLLASHDGSDLGSVLGVVESARLEKGRGVATVRFARAEDDPNADAVFRKVKDGIIQNISVGYRVHKLEKVEDGADQCPVMRATDWEPFELSVVPMGADDGAGFRSAQDTKSRSTNPCAFFGTSHRRSVMAEASTTTITPPAAAAPAVDPTERLVTEAREQNARSSEAAERLANERADRAVEVERERIAEITRLAGFTKLGDALAQRLIKAKTPLDEARKIFVDEKIREQSSELGNHIRFEAGDDARDKYVRGGCAAIFRRAGTSEMIAKAQKDERFADQFRDVALDPGEFRGFSLLALARESLDRRGVSTRGLNDEQLVRRALEFRAGDQGMNTTSDFAILLETAVNKTFLGAYAFTPVTWRRWCAQKSVKDFRTSTFYRPGSFGALDKVTEGGEVKHKNIPDGAKATLTPGTVGNIIGVNRRSIVNDDMGVFNSLAAQLGQAAALSVELDAFALITANSGLGATMADTKAVFDAAHANIGGSGAMSVTTWDSAQAILAAQTDVSGNQILDIKPSVLLCPKGLGFTAKKINAVADPTANINSAVVNPAAGMVDDIVSTARLTGTRHYFLANPAMYPVFAVGFIDGQEAPRIESQQSFEYDGVQWRVILDYGTAVLDYRGAVTSPGA